MYEEFRHVHTLYTAGCDFRGWWKLSMVLDAMQTTADRHNELLKCSRTDIREQGLTWVLFKTVLHIARYPRIGERVIVRTYTKAPCMRFIPRYYEMTYEDGRQMALAGSFWVLLDIKTKKPALPKEKSIVLPQNQDLPALVNLLSRPMEIEGKKIVSDYQPMCCDIDVNGHVNNTRYVDWLYNALGFKILQEYAIASAVIEYHRETLPGHTLRNCLLLDGNSFSFRGYEDSAMNFSLTGMLKDRTMMEASSSCENHGKTMEIKK